MLSLNAFSVKQLKMILSSAHIDCCYATCVLKKHTGYWDKKKTVIVIELLL